MQHLPRYRDHIICHPPSHRLLTEWRLLRLYEVHDYVSAVLNDGLLLQKFRDAIQEGDGPRVLRCWKAFLLYFHFARHKNYACKNTGINFVNAIATPRVAAQITWSRIVNTCGIAGHNIPVDLTNKHLNRTLKDAVAISLSIPSYSVEGAWTAYKK